MSLTGLVTFVLVFAVMAVHLSAPLYVPIALFVGVMVILWMEA